MRVRVAGKWSEGVTRSPLHPIGAAGANLPLVEDYYDGLDHLDSDEEVPPLTVLVLGDYHRRTRVRAHSDIVELNVQTAHDVAHLTRLFLEWNDGVRTAFHDLLGIVAQIFAANSQRRAACAFSEHRRWLSEQGYFNASFLKGHRYPSVTNYGVVDDQFLDCVKAFLYFHEEGHYWHELHPRDEHNVTEIDRQCDDHARVMMETLGEKYYTNFFVESIDIVLFFTLLIATHAEHCANLLDPDIRKTLFSETLQRASLIAEKSLERYFVNGRPFPSSAIPYIASAQERATKYKSQMENLLAELDRTFSYLTDKTEIRGIKPFATKGEFLRMIAEIDATADGKFERRKYKDWFDRQASRWESDDD